MSGIVTIGIPVFNGGATLKRAIESALSQTIPDCTIIIADNASTDDTPCIGKTFSRNHRNVLFIQHDRKCRISQNFASVLDQAKTPYFMWLAADDFIYPTYVEKTLAALRANPDWVGCCSRTLFIRSDGSQWVHEKSWPLLGDRNTNLARYLSNPDGIRPYALHQTKALKRAFPRAHFYAFDFAAMVGTIMAGKYGEVEEVLMVREETPASNYIRRIPHDNRSRLSRLFPMLPLSIDIIIRQKMPITPRILSALLALNINFHWLYAREFHRRYFATVKPLWKIWRNYIAWRLEAIACPPDAAEPQDDARAPASMDARST